MGDSCVRLSMTDDAWIGNFGPRTKKSLNQLEGCCDATGDAKSGVNTTCGASVATEYRFGSLRQLLPCLNLPVLRILFAYPVIIRIYHGDLCALALRIAARVIGRSFTDCLPKAADKFVL